MTTQSIAVLDIVQVDLHRFSGAVAFAVARHDHEAVRTGGRAEDRGAARCQGFDASIANLHAYVVDAPHGGSDLPGQGKRTRRIGPRHRPAAEPPDERP